MESGHTASHGLILRHWRSRKSEEMLQSQTRGGNRDAARLQIDGDRHSRTAHLACTLPCRTVRRRSVLIVTARSLAPWLFARLLLLLGAGYHHR